MKLETQVPPLSLVEPVDLWVAVKPSDKEELLFITNNTDNFLSLTPKPFRQNTRWLDSIESILQVNLNAESLAGNYTFYALYANTESDFEQLFAQARSNLAVKQTALGALTGLEVRPSNHSCLAPPLPTPTQPFPRKLSETGCVRPDDPTQPVAGVIPYMINSPLWTDGAFKRRWIAIPDKTHITIREEGQWIFPIGTILIKDFYLEEQPIETRLLVHHLEGQWAGYSYEWNDSGTEAFLLATDKVKTVKGQTWVYPSPTQCLECHNEPARFSLGPETGQMNRLRTYHETHRTASQIDTLIHIGVLEDNPVTMEQPILPQPNDPNAPIAQRAKAYLHANCAYCHRPENNPAVPHDYRFTASLSKLCRELEYYDSGVPKKHLLVAGYPEYSLIFLRMSRRDELGMPPLGTTVIDLEGMAIIEEWIRSMKGCSEIE